MKPVVLVNNNTIKTLVKLILSDVYVVLWIYISIYISMAHCFTCKKETRKKYNISH